MTTHDLRVWPEFYGPVSCSDKNFELRYDDRNYKLGDTLLLREFSPCRPCKARGHSDVPNGVYGTSSGICPECNGTGGAYTGNRIYRVVTHILREHVALQRGYVVLGLSFP